MLRVKKIVGWREWASLPQMSRVAMIAKLDTGARTCALHAEQISYFKRSGANWVRFVLFPKAKSKGKGQVVESPLLGKRKVRSSVGVETMRPLIKSTLVMAGHEFEVELTLVNRDIMGHRLLIGRSALRHGFLVDSNRTFVMGRPKKTKKTVEKA